MARVKVRIDKDSVVLSDFFATHTFSDTFLPLYGWKIHISAAYFNSEKIREIVSEFCKRERVNFKIFKNEETYLTSLRKSNLRTSANKFATLYPENIFHARKIVKRLFPLVKNERAPFIFTDFSYRNSIIHFRYGEFFPRSYRKRISSKDKFEDIKKVNNPNPFNKKPLFPQEDETISDIFRIGNYKVLTPIFFSTYGGVYLTEKKQKNFIIKEAIPFTGFSKETDHVYRKKYECSISKRISSAFFPGFIESFAIGDYFYSVYEKKDGISLDFFRNQYCFSTVWNVTNRKQKQQIEKNILLLTEKIFDLLKESKKIGLILNDINCRNLIWNGADKLSFIDLDLSFFVKDRKIIALDNFGRSRTSPSFSEDVLNMGYLLSDILFSTSFFQNRWTNHDKTLELFKECAYHYKLNEELFTRILFFLNFDETKTLDFPKKLERAKEISILLPEVKFKEAKNLDLDFEIFYANSDEIYGEEFELRENFLKAYKFIRESNSKMASLVIKKLILNNTKKIKKHFVFTKTKELIYPFLNDGAAKLILLMLRFRERFKINQFDSYILKMTTFLENKYILKSSFFDGVAGLCYLFLKLFFVFKDNRFLLLSKEFADLVSRWFFVPEEKNFFWINGELLKKKDSELVIRVLECFVFKQRKIDIFASI